MILTLWDVKYMLDCNRQIIEQVGYDLGKIHEISNKCLKDGFTNKEELFHWLRWIQSDDENRKAGSSFPYWLCLKKDKNIIYRNRDKYTLYFLHSIFDIISIKDTSLLSPNSKFNDNKIYTCDYYQEHFYYWFLRRYRIDYARQIYGISWQWNIAIPWLMIITSFSGIILYYFIKSDYKPLSIIPLAVLYLCILFSTSGKMGVAKAIHCLIPRLAATSLVGFLFIFSTPELIKFIIIKVNMAGKMILPLALFLTSIGYIVLEMTNRVKPMPDTIDTLWRTITVWGTGFMHSTFIILLCVDLLSIVTKNQINYFSQFKFLDLLILILINLSIGIVLNIVWEENPVTEPL
jgi:hypothetical protein